MPAFSNSCDLTPRGPHPSPLSSLHSALCLPPGLPPFNASYSWLQNLSAAHISPVFLTLVMSQIITEHLICARHWGKVRLLNPSTLKTQHVQNRVDLLSWNLFLFYFQFCVNSIITHLVAQTRKVSHLGFSPPHSQISLSNPISLLTFLFSTPIVSCGSHDLYQSECARLCCWNKLKFQ